MKSDEQSSLFCILRWDILKTTRARFRRECSTDVHLHGGPWNHIRAVKGRNPSLHALRGQTSRARERKQKEASRRFVMTTRDCAPFVDIHPSPLLLSLSLSSRAFVFSLHPNAAVGHFLRHRRGSTKTASPVFRARIPCARAYIAIPVAHYA